jgi:hypothetical protein
MRGFSVLILAAAAAGCLAAVPSKAVAGVSIDIGIAPVCPYGYYDAAPYAARRRAITARNGSVATYSSAPARGFTGPAIFVAT